MIFLPIFLFYSNYVYLCPVFTPKLRHEVEVVGTDI